MSGLIPPLYRSHLKEALEAGLEHPVQVAVETCEGCESCDRAVGLVRELAELSALIRIEVEGGFSHVSSASVPVPSGKPSITIRGERGSLLAFYGAPIGSELDVLVDALFAASRQRSRLPPSLARRLAGLKEGIGVEIFVSPACRRCPPVARFLMEAGVECDNLRVEVVEAFEFPELARKYGIRSVPVVVLGSGAAIVRDATVAKVASILFEMASRGGA
jgi:alkyl hydroperoxide reductase subunit AhpF